MPDSLFNDADPRLPAHILERLPLAQVAAQGHVAVINARLASKEQEFNQRLQGLQREASSKRVKLSKLYRLVDDVGALVVDHVACRNGCNHCCHIPVAMQQTEADLIGKAIGRPAVMLKKSTFPLSDRGFGYHMPCTFLKEGQCSIYEHRPLTCRTHFNLDDDAMLCELIPEGGPEVPVPLLNLTSMQVAYVTIGGEDKIGDLRDFFPPDKVA